MSRGEIVITVARGDYGRKPRPALIVQAGRFAALGSVTVAPITTDPAGEVELRIAVAPTAGNGLRDHSWVMVDKVYTARRDKVRASIGLLTPTELQAVDRALGIFLDLARLTNPR